MFDDSAFFSIWYWGAMAVFWAMFTHFILGVPRDMLDRAIRNGGEDADLFDRFARRRLTLIEEGMARYGVLTAACLGFFVALMGMVAFGAGNELAQGLVFILWPALLAGLVNLRMGRGLWRQATSPEVLIRRMIRIQRMNQVFGMLAVVAAATFFTIKHRDRLLFLAS